MRHKPWQGVHNFRDLAVEAAFVIRALFFLLFGYTINSTDVLNLTTLPYATGIVFCIFLIRAIHLAAFRMPLRPLVSIAPRGLITILLFLSVDTGLRIPLINQALVVQVILLTALVMMYGMLRVKSRVEEKAVPVA